MLKTSGRHQPPDNVPSRHVAGAEGRATRALLALRLSPTVVLDCSRTCCPRPGDPSRMERYANLSSSRRFGRQPFCPATSAVLPGRRPGPIKIGSHGFGHLLPTAIVRIALELVHLVHRAALPVGGVS